MWLEDNDVGSRPETTPTDGDRDMANPVPGREDSGPAREAETILLRIGGPPLGPVPELGVRTNGVRPHRISYSKQLRTSKRYEEAPVPEGVAAPHRPRKALQSNSAEPHQRQEARKYQRIIPEAIRAAGDALIEKGPTSNEVPGRRHTRRSLTKVRQQRSLRSLPLGGAEMVDATTAGAARERSGVPAKAPSGDLPVCVHVQKRPRSWCTPSRRIRRACNDRTGEIGLLGEHEGSPRINNPFDPQGTGMAPLRSAPAPFLDTGEGIAPPLTFTHWRHAQFPLTKLRGGEGRVGGGGGIWIP